MRVYCCDNLLETKFCPNCGGTMEQAIENNVTPFPKTFKTYLHGEKEYDVAEELGLEEGSQLYIDVVGSGIEVELEWEVTEGEELNLIGANGMKVITKREFEIFQDFKNSRMGQVAFKDA